MKKRVVGILAHVDAGKTSLSEALLYHSGALRTLGRVDHKNAFLDTHSLERDRGITIFSKQAIFTANDVEVTLLDTPGHMDFSSEMERTLQVLDCAILVISGSDGVQGHTRTLWRLLERYAVPTFLFVNKMDLADTNREKLLLQLQSQLSEACADPSGDLTAFYEQVALCSETALNQFLEAEEIETETLTQLIGQRQLFPCWFGSALKLEGVSTFLDWFTSVAPTPSYPEAWGAKVFKISRSPQGERLTHLKVTGGSLRVKALLKGEGWEEKVEQIRLYSGSKYQTADEVPAGTVCCVTGLSQTKIGQVFGIEEASTEPVLSPVLTYQVILPTGYNPTVALGKLRQLEEEDPQLHIVWKEQLREIHIQLMGEIQVEILRQVLLDRFELEVNFDMGGLVYRETIAQPVIGIGHFEPLRHYAEVHLLMEPAPQGSGLHFRTSCSGDMLDFGWQRLILTHLRERAHLGVLTGAPLTDMTFTLVAGRGHLKHTEGGDFRQATYRAVRQGLMGAESLLLEPWYQLRLELPSQQLGRALSDLQQMGAELDPHQMTGDEVVLTGSGPVAKLRSYSKEVAAYTKGMGRLFCTSGGYHPCPEQEKVVEAFDYNPEADLAHTPDSVFCTHGAGFTVKWQEVPQYAHVQSGLTLEPEEEAPQSAPQRRQASSYASGAALDKELQAIFEQTYGPVKQQSFQAPPKPARTSLSDKYPHQHLVSSRPAGPEYLLVDGYNIIFAWEELKPVGRENLEWARQQLVDLLSNYQGYKKCEVILVFDAYKVPRGKGEVSKYHNIHVVYTKEAETADAYIEKTTYDLAKRHRVRVATSDGTEQLIILGHGALRLSATAFRAEMEEATGEISKLLQRYNRPSPNYSLGQAMDKAVQEKNKP